MQALQLQIDTSKDNDSVMEAALTLLGNNGEHGWDDLLDSLNGAYDADKKAAKRSTRCMRDDMGRGALHEAVEENDYDTEWDKVRGLVLKGLMQRAMYFNALM
jgi:hypothetical protein